jgi:hypothetical protein
MGAMAMVLPRRIVEDFQSFVKKKHETLTLAHFKNLHLARTWV